MKKGRGIAIVLATLGIASCFTGCSKQFSADYAVADINGHYVLFEKNDVGRDWLGNTEDAKVLKLPDGTEIVGTNILMYTSKPDKKFYEYTAQEFIDHECSSEADYRCPQHNHSDCKE